MNYSDRDQTNVWHPYTQQGLARPNTTILRGQGVYLYDEHDRPLIDAVSSWWVNLHGHCHSYLMEAAYKQMKELDHVMFAGFTHPCAIELAERLLAALPNHQAKVFYSDNGSTAVEVALKMAVQYWFNLGEARSYIVYFENAYHGDTFGVMASSARGVFTSPFQKMFFEATAIPVPTADNIAGVSYQLEELLQTRQVAAFLFEPLVQGAGGFQMYEASHLDVLLQICRKYGVLTIADEVMTGFSRTGPMFASHALAESPDLICLSKGITGGVLPLAVTSCSMQIYEAFCSSERTKTFFHGHSYTANPIACAIACGSLDLLEREESLLQRTMMDTYFKHAAADLSMRRGLYRARSVGSIFAVDVGEGSYLSDIGSRMTAFFLERGIVIRPLGNVFYLMPPYCITSRQLDLMFEVFEEFLCDEF